MAVALVEKNLKQLNDHVSIGGSCLRYATRPSPLPMEYNPSRCDDKNNVADCLKPDLPHNRRELSGLVGLG
jgi:hypothetical protein